MSLVAVWLDKKHANIFKFTTHGVEKESFTGNFPDHHTHNLDRIEEQKQEGLGFATLIPKLSGASQILILGPGIAKTHFKKYLEDHAALLGKKIVGCETTDHPTEPQLLSFASKFFNTEHLK